MHVCPQSVILQRLCREQGCPLACSRKEVTSLSVHPSGLLALSTGRDDMLRMWNMAKGRSQYKTKIAPGTESRQLQPRRRRICAARQQAGALSMCFADLNHALAASLRAHVNQLSIHAACRAEVQAGVLLMAPDMHAQGMPDACDACNAALAR